MRFKKHKADELTPQQQTSKGRRWWGRMTHRGKSWPTLKEHSADAEDVAAAIFSNNGGRARVDEDGRVWTKLDPTRRTGGPR